MDLSALDVIDSFSGVVCRRQVDKPFDLTFVSTSVSQFGYLPDEFLENSDFWLEKIHPEDRHDVLICFEKVSESGRQRIEYRFLDATGTYVYLREDLCVRKNYDGNAKEIISFLSNISDLKWAQQELLLTSKKSLLGNLVEGIAHEINNPLTVVIGKSNLGQRKIESKDFCSQKLKEDLVKIEFSANRISKIIGGLRAFARVEQDEPKDEINLGELIGKTLDLCQGRFRTKGIDLQVDLDSDILVDGKATQIAQVIIILLNASRISSESSPQKWVQLSLKKSDDFAILMIKTTGKSAEISPVNSMVITSIIQEHNGIVRISCADNENLFEIKFLCKEKKSNE